MRKGSAHTVVALLLLASCKDSNPNNQVDEGTVLNGVYTSEEIGWTIQIPEGWSIMPNKNVQKLQNTGNDAFSESLGEEVDMEGLKNQFNMFLSTSQPFKVEYEGEYEENTEYVREMLADTFRDQGIKVNVTEIRTEKIDGIDFRVFDITLYRPDGKIGLQQSMYCSLINGYDFGVTISYNNEADKNDMLQAWENSKFKE